MNPDYLPPEADLPSDDRVRFRYQLIVEVDESAEMEPVILGLLDGLTQRFNEGRQFAALSPAAYFYRMERWPEGDAPLSAHTVRAWRLSDGYKGERP